MIRDRRLPRNRRPDADLYWPNSKSQAPLLRRRARQGGLRMSLPERHKQLDVLSEPHTGIRSKLQWTRRLRPVSNSAHTGEARTLAPRPTLVRRQLPEALVFSVTLPPFPG